MFGLITLPLVINHALLGWAKKLKSSKCWWGQCVLVMSAIFGTCTNERQPGPQSVEKQATPWLWSPDVKQSNFRHFNTNSKKVTLTVKFSLNETKAALKSQYYFVQCIKGVFGHFSKVPDNFRRFPKTTEDVWRLLKTSEELSKHLTLFYPKTMNIKKWLI